MFGAGGGVVGCVGVCDGVVDDGLVYSASLMVMALMCV